MTAPTLKPCPFCGSPAKFVEDGGPYGYTPPTVAVACSAAVPVPGPQGTIAREASCFAKTRTEPTERWAQGRGHYTVKDIAFAEVAALWNNRAP